MRHNAVFFFFQCSSLSNVNRADDDVRARLTRGNINGIHYSIYHTVSPREDVQSKIQGSFRDKTLIIPLAWKLRARVCRAAPNCDAATRSFNQMIQLSISREERRERQLMFRANGVIVRSTYHNRALIVLAIASPFNRGTIKKYAAEITTVSFETLRAAG